eukprot:278158-Rhodomonas_salina.2
MAVAVNDSATPAPPKEFSLPTSVATSHAAAASPQQCHTRTRAGLAESTSSENLPDVASVEPNSTRQRPGASVPVRITVSGPIAALSMLS